MLENNYGSGYRNAPGFLGITAQPQLDHRYINEDVGYGLVFMSRLAKQVGVETPTIDAIIQVTSILMNRDYAAEACTLLRCLTHRKPAKLYHWKKVSTVAKPFLLNSSRFSSRR